MGRGQMRLSMEDLADCVDLPGGWRIVALEPQQDPPGVWLYIEGGDLPHVVDGADGPVIRYERNRVKVTTDRVETEFWVSPAVGMRGRSVSA